MRFPLLVRLSSALLIVAASCGGSDEKGSGSQGDIPPADAWVEPAPVTDTNPDPTIVEVDLEAGEAEKSFLEGKTTAVLAYNGTVPGPLIEANVGDTLIVHFKNSLPEETTIHWHGIRLPNDMDGAPAVQRPIAAGDTFTYRFTLRDAGFFWFHPHVMEEEQIRKGLFGVIRVRGQDEPGVDDEKIVVLSDALLKEDGRFDDEVDDDMIMLGREGNVLLVNGRTMPSLELEPGALTRLRIVNVANGRFFNLALPNHTFRVIGTDGGLIPKPYDAERLLVAPGERYDVLLIGQGEPGAEIVLTNEAYARGHDTGEAAPMPLATVRIGEGPALSGRTLPDSGPAIERLPGGAADTTITFDERYIQGVLKFLVDGNAYPDVPPIEVERGSTHVFDLKNDAEMDHPFHLHGFFFQVLARDGVPVAEDALANKDTLILPQLSTTTVVARFDEPGDWMYHCHILEHAARGMMGELVVSP
ncbi:multicopper oxidase family protein [Sorangium sp. So ce381]|uniref:multicopper oxidase family protein n=1 Tax=Sorangium sp. So ce381 TaxID=3133307 RepID=UPI003F5C23FB